MAIFIFDFDLNVLFSNPFDGLGGSVCTSCETKCFCCFQGIMFDALHCTVFFIVMRCTYTWAHIFSVALVV